MADKSLTESAWKSFSKGKSYKDAAFVKSLSELDKAEKKGPEALLEALDAIEKEAAALEKANKADKALADYVDDVEKAVKRERKDAERARDEAEEAADDEPDEPALLTSKLIPLVRVAKKGEPLQVLVSVVGKRAAVLMSRKPISNSRKKLLVEYLDESGSPKHHRGQTAAGPGGGVLFEMLTGGGGKLAKLVRQAVLDQTGLRLKVQLRAADTGEDEIDGEDEDDPAASATASSAQAPAAEDPQARRYEERRAALDAPMLAVLRANHPNASKIRAVQAFADEKAGADKPDYVAALKALDQLELLIKGAAPAATPASTAAAEPAAAPAAGGAASAEGYQQRLQEVERMIQRVRGADPALADKLNKLVAFAGTKAAASAFAQAIAALGEAAKMVAAFDATGESRATSGETGYKGIVAYRTSLIEFRKAAAAVNQRIQQLRSAIPAQLPDEDDMASELSDTLTEYTDAMLEAVDAAMNASENEASPITRDLASRIEDFADEVESSELIKHVDGNPFGVKVDIGATLGRALKAVRAAMPAPV